MSCPVEACGDEPLLPGESKLVRYRFVLLHFKMLTAAADVLDVLAEDIPPITTDRRHQVSVQRLSESPITTRLQKSNEATADIKLSLVL